MERNFRQMLEAKWAEGKFVCVGLDSDYDQISKPIQDELVKQGVVADTVPEEVIFGFNWAIINATCDLVCAYKPNIAFYEAHGLEGLRALIRTTAYIRVRGSKVPIILDAKRADIGSTNKGYVQAAFEAYGVDAITVHPYLGAEALQPFLEQADKGIIVLCRTSNPGAGEFQDLLVNGEPLYQIVARRVATEWNKNGNCGVVVGATYPRELAEVRQIVGDMPILIPGVGFQQKDVPLEKQVEQVVSAGKDSRGWGMIINSSRGIIFASKGPDFAEMARQKSLELHELINRCR